jgi:hypothetical protein
MLYIDYKLTGSGWAECTISNDGQTCTITASYLSDAFGDLVLSAIAMLHSFNAVSFCFEEEPGEFRWILTSSLNNLLEIKILDGYDRDKNPTPDDECKVLFSTVSSPVELGEAVVRAGKTLLETHGAAGYLEQWGNCPFPTANFDQLLDLVKKYDCLID